MKPVITDQTNLTNDRILELLEYIGQMKDIVIVKHDGARTDKRFTVVISSGCSKFESIRCDANSLEAAMKSAVLLYLEVTG